MKIHESLVPDEILKRFAHSYGNSLMNYAANNCTVDQILSLVSLLWPKIAEDEGHFFIAEFYTGNLSTLKDQFNGSKKHIERWVNAWSLGQLVKFSSELEDEEVLSSFAYVLKHFWESRLKSEFPENKFMVEIADNIEGESGLSITFYETMPEY
ncbi:MAG: hypothetical protein H0X24_03915 [Ktedonobacterales bacterium]|nr:hypothetical protein [Ktedonobacterales bacterium]